MPLEKALKLSSKFVRLCENFIHAAMQTVQKLKF